MEILAHRGYWNSEIQSNSPAALKKALENGFGFESDVRDHMGKLVISHNIADETCQEAKEVFRWLAECCDKYCFAINIKADGLKDLLLEQLHESHLRNYFVFDMSVPQMVEFEQIGLTYFTRQSEVETSPAMYEGAAGVWIDGFWGDEWITEELLSRHIRAEKKVCLVSPDLHKREYKKFWECLAGFDIDFTKVMLCTDHPEKARKFFAEKLREGGCVR